MEYVQITLDDWVQMKQKLKQELVGVRQSFVRIGYMLRQVEEGKLYERDGYKSVAEFARAEYGLEPSTTSRFISINREYSVDGYSERLRPEYKDMSRSQLEEMLKLPDSDRKMIEPEAGRQSIRELKQFNREVPEMGIADDIRQLVRNFYQRDRDALNAVFRELEEGADNGNLEWFREIINPGGNRSFRMGMFFLMMYENKILLKRYGSEPQEKSWKEFFSWTLEVFQDSAAGGKTWEQYFGEPEKPEQEEKEEKEQEEKEEEKKQEEKEEEKKQEEKKEKKQEENVQGAAGSEREKELNEKTVKIPEDKEKTVIAPAQKEAGKEAEISLKKLQEEAVELADICITQKLKGWENGKMPLEEIDMCIKNTRELLRVLLAMEELTEQGSEEKGETE